MSTTGSDLGAKSVLKTVWIATHSVLRLHLLSCCGLRVQRAHFRLVSTIVHLLNKTHVHILLLLTLIIHEVTSELRSMNLNVDISCKDIYYRLDFDGLDHSKALEGPGVHFAVQELWWEEVDRVYPFSDSENMNKDEAQAQQESESNPARESEVLERFGRIQAQHGDLGAADEPEEHAANPTERESQSELDVNDKNGNKKKRRRSASQRNKSKKSRNVGDNTSEVESNKTNTSNGNNKNAGKGRKKVTGKETGDQAQPEQVRQRQQRLQQREAARAQAENKEKTDTGRGKRASQRPGSSSANMRYPSPRTGTPTRPHTPTPGSFRPNYGNQSPVNPLLRPAQFSHSPMGHQPAVTQVSDGASALVPVPSLTGTVEQVDDMATQQGLDREAHRRMLELNNPVPEPPAKKRPKERVPEDHTFEITYPDRAPIHDDFVIAAEMLGDAIVDADRAKNRNREKGTPKVTLRIDSRKLRCGDWIVMAEDQYTKDWLLEYFQTTDFTKKFRATLVSERGDDFNYSIKIQPPGSKRPSDEILEHLFEDIDDRGYVRINNESRFYKEPDNSGTINKAYHKSLKKGTPFDDGGVPYVKTLWLRMDSQANEIFEANPTDLNVYFRAGKLEIERVKEKKKKKPKEPETPRTDANDEQMNDGDEHMEAESEEELVQVVEASGEDGVDLEEPPGPASSVGRE